MLPLLVILPPFVAAAESEKEVESAEAEYRNKISLFGGVTQEGGDAGASIGLEYTNRVWKYLSIGALGEYAGGDLDLWLIGVDFIGHPYVGLFVRLAPMVEFVESETQFVVRIGVGYDFEVAPRWSLAPEFNVDLNRAERDYTLVYGLALVHSF
jgi:hypothetical protein